MKRSSEQILTEWLILQHQSGKPGALDTLIRMWHPLLYRYALRYLEHREDARDAVQDTLVMLDGGLKRLHDPAAFPKWVYRILHRRCVDTVRRQQALRRKTELARELRSDGAYTPDFSLSDDLHQALAGLSRDSYRIVHLHYLHGLSIDDIAAITDIPTGTVKSRLFTARKTLRAKLGGYENE